MGRRQPATDQPFHSLPLDATMLASSAQGMMPEVAHGETKVSHGMTVTRYSEITEMPAHNGLQPRANFRNRVMHSPSQLDLNVQQLRLHSFANRLPKHQKPSSLRLPADMLEAEKIEGLRLAQTSTLSVGRRMASELEEPRLFRVQFQLELLHSFFRVPPRTVRPPSLNSNPTTMSSA